MDNKVLRRLQLTELEILTDVTRFCDQNKISYMIIGGTLLGAIRHKGFVPWDDDIDIAMPREDYKKFLKLAKTGLGKKYYIQSSYDINNPLLYSKVRKNGTVFDEAYSHHMNWNKGIFIDIFPLDSAKKEKGISLFLRNQISRKAWFIRSVRLGLHKSNTVWMKVLISLTRRVPLQKLFDIQMKYSEGKNKKDDGYYVNFTGPFDYHKAVAKKQDYFPTISLVFEKKKFQAPNKPEAYLSQFFGEYLKIPAPQERKNHNATRVVFEDEEVVG